MRIYELAKELGINKKDLVAKVRNLGFPVSNFMSAIDPDSIQRIRAHMERERQANIEQVQVSKAVFRRRRKDRTAGEEQPAAFADVAQGAPAHESLAATGEFAAEAQPEIDAAERFKMALEESLRQHLERSGPTHEQEEGAALAESLRLRPKRPRTEPLIEESLTARSLEDRADSRERDEQERGEGYEERGYAEEPAEREPRPAVSEEPVLRWEQRPSSEELQEVRLSQAREETVARREPEVGEEPVAPARAAEEQAAEHRAEEPAAAAAARPAAAAGRAQPQQPGAEQPRPRVTRRPERSTTQEAVVVAIPSQEERDRRLGLTPMGARAAKGKKGKTTITRQEIYKDAPFGAGRRVSKKKVAKAAGGKTAITTPGEHKRVIRIEDTISVSELAQRMGVKAGELILTLFKMGTKVSINQSLDVDTATLVASEFGYEIKNVAFQEEQVIAEVEDRDEDLMQRAPVITMMGHVDHGKTSLLDKIRQTKVAAGEAGGITQHIGAYNVVLEDGTRIVFLDTPGHEAFTAMRARGAQATDIVVLVVAANDGVMPQTVEAIHHAKDAEVPIIVAINKVDIPGVNPDRVKQALSDHGLIPEAWGGDTMMVPVSAKTGQGIDELLDAIRVQAEVMELRANPERKATGVVLEARLETGRGTVATILVQQGSLQVGDVIIAGMAYGKVRAMTDERGKRLKKAEPSTPVEVVGLNEVPAAGDPFNVVADEKAARSLSEHRASQQRRPTATVSIGGPGRSVQDIFKPKDLKEVKLILKTDVQGSVEALREALVKLSTDEVKLSVIHEGVGGVTEGDVMLASAAGSKTEGSEVAIIAFNIRPKPRVIDLAASHGVTIKTFTVIYDAIEETKAMMAGMLAPITREKYLGRAEVRETFSIPKVGTVAGCTVQDGKIKRGSRVRLLRNDIIVWEGRLGSLRRFKDDVREVTQGFECGIGLESFNDVHLQDVIEAYETEEVAAEL